MSVDSSLKISTLRLRRSLGFPDGLGFAIQADPGLTIVHGPNGSGKTTTSLAAQALLWPGAPEFAEFSVKGGFDYEGDAWQVDLSQGAVNIQRAGQEHHHPVSLSAAARDRYSLGLHELIRADNKDFAEAVYRESSGGFDLLSALEKLGFEDKAPRRAGKVYQDYAQALQKLQQAHNHQLDLRNQEKRLQELKLLLEKLQADQERLVLLENAAIYIQAQEAFEEAQRKLDSFPPEMERVSGQETARLEELDSRIQAENQALNAASAETGQTLETLDGLNLPPEGIEPALISSLQEKTESLADWEGRVQAAEREEARAEATVREERTRLGLSPDDDRPDRIDLSGVVGLAELARRAETVRAGRLVQEALAQWLIGDDSAADPQVSQKGLDYLLEWLVEAEAQDKAKAGRLGFLLALAGALIGSGGVLAWLLHWGWSGLGLAGVLILAFLALPRTSGSPRTYNQNKFLGLDLTPPQSWTVSEVKLTARNLWEEVGRGRVAQEKRTKWAGLDAKREELAAQEAELDEQRREITSRLGVSPRLDEAALYALVESLRRYQEASNTLAQARADLSYARSKQEEMFGELGSLLSEWGYDAPRDMAGIRAAVHTLNVKTQERRSLESDLRNARRRAREARDRMAGLAAEREKVFLGLGLEPDQEAELYGLVRNLPAFRSAQDNWTQTRRELDAALEKADPDSELVQSPLYQLENDLQECRESLTRMDGTNQEIGALTQSLDQARQAHDLEEALADLDRTREALRLERDRIAHSAVGALVGRYLEERNQNENMPRVFSRAQEYFSLFTKGRYALDFDARTPEFRALDTTTRLGRGLNELSSGSRVQLLLAVRMAFVEDQEKGPRLPLFLDETLANSDPERTAAVMEATAEILKTGRQVFYFTARPSEVELWTALLEQSRAGSFAILDLEGLKGRDQAQRLPLKKTSPDRPLAPPLPEGRSREEYGRLLGVPEIDPESSLGETHVWHFLDDSDLIHQALEAGYRLWGPFKSMLQEGVLEFLPQDDPQARKALTVERVLKEALRCRQIGRGRRVRRMDLINGGITSTFIGPVADLNDKYQGRAEDLLEGLRNKEVPRFQAASLTKLEEYLEEAGCLDRRKTLTQEQVFQAVLEAVAPDLKEGALDPARVEVLVSRLNYD